MIFLKLTKFKFNPDVLTELADKIAGTKNYWQVLNFEQYPKIIQMINDNNIPNIVEIVVNTTIGPVTRIVQPVIERNANGIRGVAPFRVYIPLGGTPATLYDDSESIEISEPIVVAGDKHLRYSLPANSVSHMLTIYKGDGEFNGRMRFIKGTVDTLTENKLRSFAKFCGLV